MIALKNKNQTNSNGESNAKANKEYEEALFVQKKLNNDLVVFDFDIDKVIEMMDSLLEALNEIDKD
jgi:hypothetical protein